MVAINKVEPVSWLSRFLVRLHNELPSPPLQQKAWSAQKHTITLMKVTATPIEHTQLYQER